MEKLVPTILKLSQEIKDTLRLAKDLRLKNKDLFFEKNYTFLGRTIKHYVDCFRSLEIKKTTDYDDAIKRNYRSEHLRDAVEELSEVEDNWADFLNENDLLMNQDIARNIDVKIKIGDQIDLSNQFMDVKNERLV